MTDLSRLPIDPHVTAILVELAGPLNMFFELRANGSGEVARLVDKVESRLMQALLEGREIGHVGRYAFGVAKNVLREYWRSEERERLALKSFAFQQAEVAELDLSWMDDNREMLETLRACLLLERPKVREFILRFYNAEDHLTARAQIAEDLNLSPNALYIRASRVRKRLRKCVERRLPPQ